MAAGAGLASMMRAFKMQMGGNDSDNNDFTVKEATRLKALGNAAFKDQRYSDALLHYASGQRLVAMQKDPLMIMASGRSLKRDAKQDDEIRRLGQIIANNKVATQLKMCELSDADVVALPGAFYVPVGKLKGLKPETADERRHFMLTAAEGILVDDVLKNCKWADIKKKGEYRLEKVRAWLARLTKAFCDAYPPSAAEAAATEAREKNIEGLKKQLAEETARLEKAQSAYKKRIRRMLGGLLEGEVARVTQRVDAKAASGRWWPAVVTRVHPDGRMDVDVDDGRDTKWKRMPRSSIRLLSWDKEEAPPVQSVE